MPRSIPEFIVLGILIIICLVTLFVYTADGLLLVKVLSSSQTGAPDKDQVVALLHKYKESNGKYPDDLQRVGVFGKQFGTVLVEYVGTVDRFDLCYRYFPYMGMMASCYDSKAGQWEVR